MLFGTMRNRLSLTNPEQQIWGKSYFIHWTISI